MTLTAKDGGRILVLPGVRSGNIYLGPQPLRNSFERATQTQHDVLTPPPHAYIAAYLWYRNEFKADAVVHMGRHGTLEWLPGKHVGQAGWDGSEVLLGDLPNPYYFIIDGGGEAIQARRRSAGVMIGHLTPMIVPAGMQSELVPLDTALERWESVEDATGELAREYQKQAMAEIRRLKLDAQLGFRLDQPWEEVFQKVHTFIHDVEDSPAPLGQQTVGALPSPAVREEALAEFLRSGFQPQEQRQLKNGPAQWATALMAGESPAVDRGLAPALAAKAKEAVAEGQLWLRNLNASGARETGALVNILNGKYHESGMLGDPLRNPASIPSGRNLHDFDTALIPTKAACEVGKRMGVRTIEKFKADTGRFPEKVSMVLWYGETGRSHGAMECEAMYLLGVEPKWNPRGVVDSLRLIPDAELGRPRVDVLFTISGIYRDGFGDKALWLDKAVRLAASAGSNVIRKHDEETAAYLRGKGIEAAAARDAAEARVFGAAPGMYGVGGIAEIVSQSLDEAKEKGLGEMYLHHMNHAYSGKIWGRMWLAILTAN
jgi:cobaltochelatase CobN